MLQNSVWVGNWLTSYQWSNGLKYPLVPEQIWDKRGAGGATYRKELPKMVGNA